MDQLMYFFKTSGFRIPAQGVINYGVS